MKRKLFIISTLLLFFLFYISCNEDESTELSWINGDSSTAAINDIVWADDDAVWSKVGGYDIEEQTESKEVDQLIGEVACDIYDEVLEDFITANVIIEDTNSSSLSLTEGESYVYTINAEPTP